MNRGVARRTLNELDGARVDMTMVTRLMPSTPDPYEMLAIIDEAAGRLDSALKSADKAISMSPKNADLYALRALVLFRKKDLGGANRDVAKSLSLDPRNAKALFVKYRIRSGDTSPTVFQPQGDRKAPSAQITIQQRQMRKGIGR